ncbi:pleckstrin homology domain-containing family A member 8-like [Babylonia areolata]|uniref:pleckstrin homology domain-containing family A member 8-like n=1 Tax=Babylonia areolata TaxID=304850 RepID=UPI003FD2BBC5
MEGVLWKWTNYLSGWQPRWFVLESGVLSYYKSQEDVNNGCKGSIKMNACDIKVHPTDNTRLDLIIPGEQHYYVKAAQPQERQSWLIALGSAKAKYSQPSAQEAPLAGELSTDIMRTKKSELRLYCDLLMQQVHSVKQSVTQKSEGEATAVPDVEKLNEATSLLSATCDTFIQTLDDVMKMVQDTPAAAEATPSSPKRLSTSSSNSRLSVSRSNSTDKSTRNRQSSGSVEGTNLVKSRRRSRASSEGSHSDVSLSEPTSSPLSNSQQTVSKEGVAATEGSISTVTEEVGPRHNGVKVRAEEGDGGDEFKDAIDSRILTFFSAMSTSFVHIKASEEDGVPVQPFLDACKELVPIFDKLNSTAFAPVKMDFSGNIRKIQQKQTSAIAAGSPGYPSVQAMVLSEVTARQHTNSNSATVALRWLKRGLEFIREFLREVCSGGPDLAECASNAYSRTLKNYHGWVVRGVFAVAVKALPYRSEFLNHLAAGECDSSSPQYLHSLMGDMEVFLQHLNSVILIIDAFYTKQQLDVQEQV